jgi:hypothetical protein
LSAATITFDDINTGGTAVDIADGYQGLGWANFGAVSALSLEPNTGYAAGLVSGPNDAFNEFAQAAQIYSFEPFTLTSGYFTGAWYDGLNLEIQGFDGDTLIDAETIVLSSTAPSLEVFNWTGVNDLIFSSFGGTPNPLYLGGGGPNFVMDNLVINSSSIPEPSEYSMIGVGLLALIVLRKRS